MIGLQFDRGESLSGSQLYRQNIPLFQLGRKGWATRIENIYRLLIGYGLHGQVVFDNLVDQYDLFIFPRVVAVEDRTLEGLASLVRQIRAKGKRIVYEVDDDFTERHRQVGAHRAMEVASWCDAITVTTPYLAEIMKRETGRPVYVLPNMLDPVLWKDASKYKPHEGLVVGLSGSPTHVGDWQVMRDVFPRLLKNTYPVPVRYVLMGYCPDWLREVPAVEFIPPMDYQPYAQQVRQFDLVLAPVDPTDGFNLGKSPIKVIEGMGASRPIGGSLGGAACIATDNEVYRLAITHGHNGLLCTHTADSWYTAIDQLLRNTPLREQLQLNGHRTAWKRHDITKTWVQWARAYQSIASRPLNPIIPLSKEN